MEAPKKDVISDAVKAQGILQALVKKEGHAAKEWDRKWGFYKNFKDILEEEAAKEGLSKDEYWKAVKKLSSEPDPIQYPVTIKPSPTPYPRTSNATVGWRSTCSLEQYGRLVRTQCDYPVRPPPKNPPYDPFKQTIIFLGIDYPDPISYPLKPEIPDLPEAIKNLPVQPTVAPLSYQTLQRAHTQYR